MTNVHLADLIVPETESLMACMRRLDAAAHKTLFVVDSQQALVGALTDGDIRRWILSGGSLSGSVERVCNRAPAFVAAGSSREHLGEVVSERGVDALPMIDGSRRIVSVVFRADLEAGGFAGAPARQPVDVPVVIMAGGAGARLQPFTAILPKPLIPIGDRSVVEHIIDRFCEQGVSEFHMSLGHKARLIRAYFEDRPRNYSLSFYEEDRPLGTAGALRLMQHALPSSFLLTNCDILISADYADFLAFHRLGGHAVSLVSSVRHFRVPYGVCEIDRGGRLVAIHEKPEHHYLISTGLYALERAALELVPVGEFTNMTDLISAVQASGGTVGVYPISEGAWSDTGEWPEYQKTVARLTGQVTPPGFP